MMGGEVPQDSISGKAFNKGEELKLSPEKKKKDTSSFLRAKTSSSEEKSKSRFRQKRRRGAIKPEGGTKPRSIGSKVASSASTFSAKGKEKGSFHPIREKKGTSSTTNNKKKLEGPRLDLPLHPEEKKNAVYGEKDEVKDLG